MYVCEKCACVVCKSVRSVCMRCMLCVCVCVCVHTSEWMNVYIYFLYHLLEVSFFIKYLRKLDWRLTCKVRPRSPSNDILLYDLFKKVLLLLFTRLDFFEWQQVSSRLQDSSQYFSRSQ